MAARALPPLNAVRAFEAAARHRSMSAAAEELGVTAGAVSRQVRELETRLGERLFRRTAAGLVLTPTGEQLARSSCQALDMIAEATGAARPKRDRRLSIGVYSVFLTRVLLPIWPKLQEALPDLEIELHSSADPLDLLPSRFDAVIDVGDGRPRAGQLVRPLTQITSVVVCAPALAAEFDPATTPQLHARPRPDDWRRWLDHAGYTEVPARVGGSFESIGVALDAAAAGLGAVVAMEQLLAPDRAAGRLVIAHPSRRPTRRCFALHAVAPAAQDRDLIAFADWLEVTVA